MHLGPNMRRIRELHGKSLREVAGHLSVDGSLVSLIERQLRDPSQDYIKRWLDLFFMDEKPLREGPIAWSIRRRRRLASRGARHEPA